MSVSLGQWTPRRCYSVYCSKTRRKAGGLHLSVLPLGKEMQVEDRELIVTLGHLHPSAQVGSPEYSLIVSDGLMEA